MPSPEAITPYGKVANADGVVYSGPLYYSALPFPLEWLSGVSAMQLQSYISYPLTDGALAMRLSSYIVGQCPT